MLSSHRRLFWLLERDQEWTALLHEPHEIFVCNIDNVYQKQVAIKVQVETTVTRLESANVKYRVFKFNLCSCDNDYDTTLATSGIGNHVTSTPYMHVS